MKNVIKLIGMMFFFTFLTDTLWGQSGLNRFLTPSDTLNKLRRTQLILFESAAFAGGIIDLNSVFKRNTLNSNFHFITDFSSAMQMDKVAHVFVSYQLGNASANALQWSGVSKKNQLIYGATMGFVFLTTVEFVNGFNPKQGASVSDIIANGVGTSLYVAQDLLWHEQRIVPKFSFQTSQFMSANPRILKSQLMCEFNSQTYWLSVNLYSFFKKSEIPKWLNLAVGYGVEGLVNGNVLNNSKGFGYKPYRQFYLSADLDLTKIKTNSHVLKTVFSLVNVLKIPAPTLEINELGGIKGHFVYF